MAIRFTPTPTPSITPTISLTPSYTPTITPTQTTCPYVCCWPTTGATSWGALITEMKPFKDNESFWLWAGFSFNGQTWGSQGARFNPCGVVLNSFTGNCVNPFRGGGNNAGMFQQSDGKVIIYVNANVSRYNVDYTPDYTFNTIYLTGNSNSDLFGGCYVNPSDEIYILGLYQNDPITECSGTSHNFNTNIYKIKKDGGIDTSYSGITIGTIPSIQSGEPRLMTSENDPDGKVLVIRFSAFTGNSTWAPIMRMNPNGLPDPTFNNSAFSAITAAGIYTTYAQKDGKYMVGGAGGSQFLNIGGLASQGGIVRLNNNGTLDTTFVNGLNKQYTITDIEQDIEGNYHITWQVGGPAYGYSKLSNTGSVIFSIPFSGPVLAVMCWEDTVYVGGFQSTYILSNPNIRGLWKFDLYGNLNICPVPSPTPTMTPTQTITPTPSTTPPVVSPSTTPTNTPTPSKVSYMYAGGASTWGTSTLACSNKTCARPYFKAVPSWAPGTIVYDDSALTTTFNGGGNWIAVDTSTGTFCSGLAWAAVQVDSSGVILNFVSCP